IGLSQIIAVSDSQESAPTDPTRPWPLTCQEAIDHLISKLDEPSKALVRDTWERDLILFHNGWGMGSRNSYGMWRGNTALVDSCAARRPGAERHPDEASMIIIEEVWKALQP